LNQFKNLKKHEILQKFDAREILLMIS